VPTEGWLSVNVDRVEPDEVPHAAEFPLSGPPAVVIVGAVPMTTSRLWPLPEESVNPAE
jgi:hypothetical protein